jgi:hypothetical protein
VHLSSKDRILETNRESIVSSRAISPWRDDLKDDPYQVSFREIGLQEKVNGLMFPQSPIYSDSRKPKLSHHSIKSSTNFPENFRQGKNHSKS